MSQIKPTQIIPGRKARTNPLVGLPIDLNQSQRPQVPEHAVPTSTQSDATDISSGTSPGEGSTTNVSGSSTATNLGNVGVESLLQQEETTPGVPAILSVKEEVVRFMPDGTARVDLVLVVQDIPGAVEYDIRVAKDAGNL